ncbi:MAG: hypothetical protein M3Q72_09365 [Actinomycetota bacterium]|nr:hypothetical protein [Actinomycetota bacterium]
MTYSDVDIVEIAECARGPTTPFAPTKSALSTRFRWFADDDRLCVIAPDLTMKASAADVGFAHALGHLGDRELIVVLPKTGAEAVAQRLPFLDVPARCFELTAAGIERIEPMRPADVFALYVGTHGGVHDVSVGLQLAAPLVRWLDQRAGLVVDDRSSYRTWHYKGRQVLTLRMATKTEAELVAGVNYSTPEPGLEPVVLRLSGTMTGEQLNRVQDAIDTACSGKDSGADVANAEHLLQERLRTQWKPLGLGAAPLREVPVRRPVGRGYIDLLGAGADGRIHVIEIKLGPFDQLVVQGLDYWIWANANRPALAERLDLPADAEIEIDYVVAEKTPGHGLIGSYTSGQAEALQGAIRWRFTEIRDWTGAGAPTVKRLPLRTMPLGSKGRPAPRKTAPRWSVRLAHHLAHCAAADGVTLGGGVFWPNATDGLEPAAALVHERLVADGLAHHMVGHVRSSQAFALNLFAPLDENGRRGVAAALGVDAAAVSEPLFEWSDPEDQLRERTHASPHATQVDVRFDCVAASGARFACLIEVKLSEPDFNPCSAWLSPNNDSLDVCATSGPFGNDTGACFQLRNHDREHRRTYDTALGTLVVDDAGGTSGCWFRFGGNQVMRNVALGRSLIERGAADEVVVALCAPNGHRAVWRRWAEAKQRLAVVGVTLVELPAETVVQHHASPSPLAARYLLDLPEP